ncbi:MAG: hypothetical protein M3Q99_10985 [Acidobacteriota bacterium]|nr:hypothetical protein [Acidobacteriota bacterium]
MPENVTPTSSRLSGEHPARRFVQKCGANWRQDAATTANWKSALHF